MPHNKVYVLATTISRVIDAPDETSGLSVEVAALCRVAVVAYLTGPNFCTGSHGDCVYVCVGDSAVLGVVEQVGHLLSRYDLVLTSSDYLTYVKKLLSDVNACMEQYIINATY